MEFYADVLCKKKEYHQFYVFYGILPFLAVSALAEMINELLKIVGPYKKRVIRD